ncbi:MAG: hypothetical protein WDO14_05090 [Bacteroidota bacterium]
MRPARNTLNIGIESGCDGTAYGNNDSKRHEENSESFHNRYILVGFEKMPDWFFMLLKKKSQAY